MRVTNKNEAKITRRPLLDIEGMILCLIFVFMTILYPYSATGSPYLLWKKIEGAHNGDSLISFNILNFLLSSDVLK